MRTEKQQSGKETQLKHVRPHPRPQPLPKRHAEQRRNERQRRRDGERTVQHAVVRQSHGQGDRRTVNVSPSACTRSSFSSPSACRYGPDGMTNTPVAALIRPVTTPTAPTARLAARRHREAHRAQSEDRIEPSARRRAPERVFPFSAVRAPAPGQVPAQIPSSIGQSRRSSGLNLGRTRVARHW